MPWPALTHVRVLEVGSSLAAAYAAKLLADYGAQVLRVQVDGAEDRVADLPPSTTGAQPRSLTAAYLGTGKTAVDGATADDVVALAAGCDVLVTGESGPYADLVRAARAAAPHLVHLEITPYGAGRRPGLGDHELLVEALGGWAFGIGSPRRRPLKAPGWQSSVLAGTVGAGVALGAVLDARRTGAGEHVDLSQQACVAWFLMNPTTVYEYSGSLWRRDGGESPTNYPQAIMRCRDGVVGVNVMYYAEWDRLCALLGRDDWQQDPRLATPTLRLQHREVIDEVLRPWLLERDMKEVSSLAQQWKLPFAEVESPATLLQSDHLRAREFWETVDQPGVGPVVQPGPPVRVAAGGVQRSAATALRHATVTEVPPRTAPTGDEPAGAPLRGVRVLDLTMAWAGPLATRVLRELGAEVIKIESASHLDRWRGGTTPQRGVVRYPDSTPYPEPWNRNAFFNTQNRGKESLSLDLKTERGKQVFRELVAVSDLVVENFGAGAMGRLGLDYPDLREINPTVSMLSMPAFGRTGPKAGYVAHGPTIEAAAGNVTLQGYEDGEPLPSGLFAWGDPVAGVTGSFAALAALSHRAATGTGAHWDLSHLESGILFNVDAFLEQSVLGRARGPVGNADPTVRWQDTVRCGQDDDTWVAVVAPDEAARVALCGTVGAPAGTDGGDLREQVQEWADARSQEEVLALLGRVPGVSAAPLHTARTLLEDPVLVERGFFRAVEHPVCGRHRYPTVPWVLDARGGGVEGPAPLFGQHTDEVLARVLGYPPEVLRELEESGVTTRVPAEQGD